MNGRIKSNSELQIMSPCTDSNETLRTMTPQQHHYQRQDSSDVDADNVDADVDVVADDYADAGNALKHLASFFRK